MHLANFLCRQGGCTLRTRRTNRVGNGESQYGKVWRAEMQEGALVITEYVTETNMWSAGCQQCLQT